MENYGKFENPAFSLKIFSFEVHHMQVIPGFIFLENYFSSVEKYYFWNIKMVFFQLSGGAEWKGEARLSSVLLMKTSKAACPVPVTSIWGCIASLVSYKDENDKKFSFGHFLWAIWQSQVEGSKSKIDLISHFPIYYFQGCLGYFKRAKIVYINHRRGPRNTILENIELLKFSQTTLDIIFGKNGTLREIWESRVFVKIFSFEVHRTQVIPGFIFL